jgi:hypothetical protein
MLTTIKKISNNLSYNSITKLYNSIIKLQADITHFNLVFSVFEDKKSNTAIYLLMIYLCCMMERALHWEPIAIS